MTPTEITVFLPFAPDALPVDTARALVEALQVAHAFVGDDLLTGAVTVRIPWAKSIRDAAATYLVAAGVAYEITVS